MNPVKLKFRHGGEMLVSPIGLRFVEDPDHGPLVLVPEAQGPRGYQLDMTLEQAREACKEAAQGQPLPDYSARKIEELEQRADAQRSATHLLEARIREFGGRLTGIEARFGKLFDDYCRHEDGSDDHWQALAIHLGLPEGWEHLNEGAAEVKGALVSQAEEIDTLTDRLATTEDGYLLLLDRLGLADDGIGDDRQLLWIVDKGIGLRLGAFAKEINSVKAHVDALYSELGLNSRWEGEKLVSYRDTDSILTEVVLMQREVSRLTEESPLFRVAEKVGELEESRRIQREFLAKLSDEVRSLRAFQEEIHPTLSEKWEDTAFPLLDDRTCVQRSTWTVPQSVDRIETGRIEDEVNRLHGELDARVSDLENRMDEEQSRIRTPWIGPDTVRLVLPEPEKPKSAWRPAAECDRAGWYLLRVPGYGYTARPCYYRNFWDRSDLERAGFKNGIACLEFCPIPE